MTIIPHLPVLIVALPLSAALLCVALSMLNKSLGKCIVIVGLAGSFACAVRLLIEILAGGSQPIHYAMGNWDAPLGIEFVVDPLNGFLVCLITFIALCAGVYSLVFINRGQWIQQSGYYAMMGLLTVGLCGMTLTGDVFNLYVYLEISSLSCYGLIALGGNRSIPAAFRYLMIGTIGASFYLMAIGFLYAITGSLNMADMSELLQGQMDNPLVLIACVCLVAAFGIKMAIFPFHVWQPDAYSFSHPGASPLISGAMSKVPAFAMIRFFYFLFGIDHLVIQHITLIIGIMGAIGMLYGSIMALTHIDFRRILAYSSVAQLGYIALGIGIGNYYGLTGGYLHLVNHIFMKGGLFFAIGAIQYRYGIININQFGQLHKKMPLTCFTLVMGSLAMVGIPPTGGFFSKWYLMMGALDKKMYVYIVVLILSSLLNAVYFLRVLEKIFIAPAFNLKLVNDVPKHLEVPARMLIPVVLFGIGIVLMGVFNGTIVNTIVNFTMQGVV